MRSFWRRYLLSPGLLEIPEGHGRAASLATDGHEAALTENIFSLFG